MAPQALGDVLVAQRRTRQREGEVEGVREAAHVVLPLRRHSTAGLPDAAGAQVRDPQLVAVGQRMGARQQRPQGLQTYEAVRELRRPALHVVDPAERRVDLVPDQRGQRGAERLPHAHVQRQVGVLLQQFADQPEGREPTVDHVDPQRAALTGPYGPDGGLGRFEDAAGRLQETLPLVGQRDAPVAPDEE
ncbi:hypothetical protein IPZ68_15375 [Streptomyces arenae]|nr:hypothetical protein [Streptomyces arenae]